MHRKALTQEHNLELRRSCWCMSFNCICQRVRRGHVVFNMPAVHVVVCLGVDAAGACRKQEMCRGRSGRIAHQTFIRIKNILNANPSIGNLPSLVIG